MKKLLACALAAIGLGASAPANPPDNIIFVPGSTQKICQVTGETDREFPRPTTSQTTSRFGLVGADLGYSFEHDGKLFFLFGDTIPSRSFKGRPNALSPEIVVSAVVTSSKLLFGLAVAKNYQLYSRWQSEASVGDPRCPAATEETLI